MTTHILTIALAAGAALAILLLAAGLARLAMTEGGRRKTEDGRLPPPDFRHFNLTARLYYPHSDVLNCNGVQPAVQKA